MENQNSHLLKKGNVHINPYNASFTYKNLCSVNYRLNIVSTQYSDWLLYKMDDLYLQNYKINIFKNSKELRKVFDEVLVQEPLHISEFVFEDILDNVFDDKYIIGLFDCFRMKNNSNYCRDHTYNTFLIYGYAYGKFIVYINHGIKGSFKEKMNIRELEYIFESTLDKINRKNRSEMLDLGFPISTITLKKVTINDNIYDLYYNIKRFYNSQNSFQNLDIFNFFYENGFDYFMELHNNGADYHAIVNQKIIIDFFKCQNTKLRLLNIYSDIIENNNKIINNTEIIISKFAKYVYSNNKKYFSNSVEYFYQNIELLEKNKKIINNRGK